MARRSKTTDSLEFFLDTICNTFGGILLILLVVLLMQKSPASSHYQSDLEISDLESLRDHLESLNLDIPRKESELSVLQSRSVKLAELDERLKTKHSSEEDLFELDQKISELNTKLSNIDEVSVDQLKEELESLQSKNAELDRKISMTENKNTRSLSMPKLAPTYNKEPIFLFLSGGRLYQFPSDDVDTTEDEILDGFYVDPKPFGGIDMNSEVLHKKIDTALHYRSPNSYMITLFVRDDSFKYYNPLYNELKGFGYGVSPRWYSGRFFVPHTTHHDDDDNYVPLVQ